MKETADSTKSLEATAQKLSSLPPAILTLDEFICEEKEQELKDEYRERIWREGEP